MMNFFAWRSIQHSTRTAIFIMACAVLIEVSIISAAILFKQLFTGAEAVYNNDDLYRTLIIANSIIGFLGALLLAYGALSFIRGFRISKSAEKWVYAASIIFLLFKAFDILQTVHWLFLSYLFGLWFDLDIFLSNVMLVSAATALLIGMMRALYDANQAALQSEAQNVRLDTEIQERKKTETQARESEERLSSILNALSSPIFLSNKEGVVMAHNQVFASLYGKGEYSLVGKHLQDLLPEPLYETGRTLSMRVFEQNHAENSVIYHNQYAWETTIFPVKTLDGNVPCVTVLAVDITERQRNEEDRRLLETAINNAAECIIITDVEGRIEYVNPAFEEQTGYNRHEIMGRTPSLLKSGKHNDDYYRELWQTIKKGEVWRGRFINRTKKGELFHENATISPIMNQEGKISHFVAVKRNVSREILLEQQLQQSQKIEALGTLAGGVAHDLNNVLAIILGRSELVLDMLEEQHPARESLNTIMRTAGRSSTLIKRLLTFTRQGAGESGPLCIAQLVKEQIKVIRAFLPSNVRLVEQITISKENIISDPSEVQQIVVNLLNNANHALQPAGGAIEISLGICQLNTECILTTGTLAPGNYIRLSVRDTGCGMEDAVLQRIFDPFFTTKDIGEGTGLGLAMVHGSILRSGGQIHVESTPGQGTVFELYWPEGPLDAVPAPTQEARVSGKGITVMVIDDLTDFTDLLSMNLQNYGYTVKPFSEVESALAYFKDKGHEVNIAVVDYMMPRMNGREVAKALHHSRPDLPVVLLSGYASGITNESAQEHGFCALFEKPVAIDRLTRELARLALPSPQSTGD